MIKDWPAWKTDYVDRVLAASDIVDVVGGYLPIMRVGRNWRSHCPFHRESTQSFYINPEKQAYYCFGCGAGGSVFKFVMEYERIDFDKAVDRLAEIFNVLKFSGHHLDDHNSYDRDYMRGLPGVDGAVVKAEHDAARSSLRKSIIKNGGRP